MKGVKEVVSEAPSSPTSSHGEFGFDVASTLQRLYRSPWSQQQQLLPNLCHPLLSWQNPLLGVLKNAAQLWPWLLVAQRNLARQ